MAKSKGQLSDRRSGSAIEGPSEVGIYDPSALRRALETNENAVDSDEVWTPAAPARTTENEVWANCLRRILEDRRGHTRPALYGSDSMLSDLVTATAPMGHFAAVSGIIERAIVQSCRAGCPLRFPPILMISEPGVGKSFYCRAVAAALSTTVVPIAINMTSDRGSLGGLSQVWRGAKLGRLAKGILVDSETAAPLFVLDELDKAPSITQGERTLDVLLMAMEPENSSAYVDEYLEIPIRLDHALWLASANEVRSIPEPLLSRMLVLEVPTPTREQAVAMIRGIAAPILQSSFLDGISDDALGLVLDLSARRARQVIELASGYALYDSRAIIDAEDVRRSLRLVGGPERRAIGFL